MTMRIRIAFEKNDAIRFTSHLDLHRIWGRTLRRAGLPLAYSKGFNPRPRINLASALPLGFTSKCEFIDIWLESELALADIQFALLLAAPPGIQINRIQEVDMGSPSMQTQVIASEYIVKILEPVPNLAPRLTEILTAKEILRNRRGKDYNLRPLIEDIHRLSEDEDGYQHLHMRLTARESATGRPEEVLDTLGIPPHTAHVCRIKLIFQEPEQTE